MSVSAPCGTWPSPITPELITAGTIGLDALSCVGSALYWLEARPLEQGRVVLVEMRDGERRDLTPPPYNVRSRVHEYGGGAYVAYADAVYFVNFADQDVYRIVLATRAIERITHAAGLRFADMRRHAQSNSLIAVAERAAQPEPENTLVAIDLSTGGVRTLHAGHDFYAAPRLSPDGGRIAFLAWDHPNMPWDGTQLHTARLDAHATLSVLTTVAGGMDESIAEPEWLTDETLVFATDRTGYWNLHACDASGVHPLVADPADYATPHWGFGARTWAPLSERYLLARRVAAGDQSLVVVDVQHAFASPVESAWRTFDSLARTDGGVAFVAGAVDRLAAVVLLDPESRTESVLHTAGDLSGFAPWFSAPEPIAFSTRDGALAHAYFYPPRNPGFAPPPDARPPLLVMSHGGPTASATPTLNPRIQFYTSRGWAVLDVNYRGSTGFGRAYRRALDGKWGVVDVTDCEDGVRFLARSGRIDADRVAIRGGSAGGYTTLCALTFGSTFAAGASWYGIGDLELLAADTHKFESRYIERLVGPYPAQRDLYRERSPVHHVDRLSAGVIFLQGLEDRVVPPNQAEAMVNALRAKQLPVAYVTFPGEGHGFRDARNIQRAIEAEFSFFARVFRIPGAESLPSVEIENLC
jgi:dipeptidyl aminopeptidase/acylaminoacyl peptidase